MENWGLITFRESYLLADPATAGLQEQLGVASIIAHEMAHMVSVRSFVLPTLSLGQRFDAEGRLQVKHSMQRDVCAGCRLHAGFTESPSRIMLSILAVSGMLYTLEERVALTPAWCRAQLENNQGSVLQWFGDTTTFAFWGDLWLAEGPATYFEVGLCVLIDALLCSFRCEHTS